MAQIIDHIAQYTANNPGVLVAQGVALGVGIFAMPVALPVLGALGFGAAGPVAGECSDCPP